jgi:hypothetical protein
MEVEMAGLTHLGVGLAAKPAAPNIPLTILILSACAIDIIWGVFFLAGLEGLPEPGAEVTNAWSHGLFMAVIWSLLASMVARLVSGEARTSLVVGLLVFGHWIVDFISHPMTAVFPDDSGLPLLFEGSPVVGLGLWGSQLGVAIGEYGILVLGLAIYISTRLKWRRQDRTPLVQE